MLIVKLLIVKLLIVNSLILNFIIHHSKFTSGIQYGHDKY